MTKSLKNMLNNLINLKYHKHAAIAMALAVECVYALETSKVSQTTGGDADTEGGNGGSGKFKEGVGKIVTYLKYSMWAASAIGIISVGFMLLSNTQETILKNAMKIVGVICVIALGFTAPTWFGLNVIL